MNNVVEVGFNYSEVDEVCRDDVRDAAVRIKVRMARTAADIIDIGRDLISVKKALGHGHFIRWIEVEFGMTVRTAQRLIGVCERVGDKYDSLSHLGNDALYALTAPSTPDDVVEEVAERASNGETFTAADIKAMKDEFSAEKRELKKQIEDVKLKAKDARATQEDFGQQLQSLRSELADLRNQRDTLRHELENARRGAVGTTKIVNAVDDREAVEKQVAALLNAWNKASAEARQEFLDRIDTPVFDRNAA